MLYQLFRLPIMRALSSAACMVTAVTIWWGCWQWAHEANTPRVAMLVEEQAPSAVESSRADYDDLQALTQEVTSVVSEDTSGVEPANAVNEVVPIGQIAAAANEDSLAWPSEPALLTFSRAVTDLVLPGVLSAPEAEVIESPLPERPEPVFLGDFQLTYYWISNEYAAEEEERSVQLYDKTCRPLHKVTSEFADRLSLEGTGRLKDGRTLNVDGECECGFSPCFFVTRRNQRWGVGVETRPLVPFRSVAVDTYYIPAGTKMYIPEFDGLTMPGRSPYGGFVHDGCVVADDTGGGVDDAQIDFFFALKGHYQGFDRRHRIKNVRAYRDHGRCSEPGDPGLDGPGVGAPERLATGRISV